MPAFLAGPSHATRWADDINKGRLPEMPGVTIWGEGGLALFSERLRSNIALHAAAGKDIWLIVPDFRFGISFFKDHADFSETGKFLNGYTMIQRDFITPERDALLYQNGLEVLDYYANTYGKRIRFVFWCLVVREQRNILTGKYVDEKGVYRHPVWNHQELLARYSDNTVDIWPMTQSFNSYVIDQQGHPSTKANAFLYHAFRTGSGQEAFSLMEERFPSAMQLLFDAPDVNADPVLNPNDPIAIAGSHRVLFLDNDTNRGMDQHRGLFPMNAQQRNTLTQTLRERKQAMDVRGIDMTYLVAPDKQTVYWHNLPEPAPQAANHACAEVLRQCAAAGIPVVYPADALRESAMRGLDTYDKVDTHWNGVGAFVAYEQLMAHFAASGRVLRKLDRQDMFFSHYSSTGDLGNKIAPVVNATCVRGRPMYPQAREIFDNNGANGIVNRGVTRVFECPMAGNTSIVVFGDSFHVALMPYLAESFGRTVFAHRAGIDWELLDREKPDVVLFEMAERFLINFPADAMSQPTPDIVLAKLRTAGPEEMVRLLPRLDLDLQVPEAVLHRALVQIAANRYPAAEESLRQAIALKPDWKLLHYYLGLTLIETGKIAEARERFGLGAPVLADPLQLPALRKNKAAAQRAATEAPDWGFAHHILSGVCMQDKQYAEARTHQEQAVKCEPSSPYAAYRMAQIYHLTENPVQAEHWFKQAVTFAPRFVAALSALAHLLLQENRLEDSGKYYSEAIAFSPHDAELPLMRGVTWLKRGDLSQAIEDFSVAVGLDPKMDRAYVQMGVAYRKMGQMKEAQAALQQAVAANPGNASARRELDAIKA